MKKAAFLLVFCALATLATAQTKRIAHRSHSGRSATLRLEREGNFGEVDPIYYEKLRRMSDSMQKADSIAKVMKDRGGPQKPEDRIKTKPSPQPQPKAQPEKPKFINGHIYHGADPARKPED